MAQVNRHLPLRERHGLVPARDLALDPNVSIHLAHLLWDWCCRQQLQMPESDSESSKPQLSLRAHRMCATLDISVGDRMSDLKDFAFQDPNVLLDMVDWILREQHNESIRKRRNLLFLTDPFGKIRIDAAIDDMRSLLLDAGSAWKVAEPPDHLELRVLESLEEVFRTAVSEDDEISQHLTNAWDAASRRNVPSIDEAYRNAVKAVESVLVQIVTPADPKPSLGKMISALRDKPEKWETRFRGVESVNALAATLDELWMTDSRHAGMPPNSLEQAQDAVAIAVAVVSLVRRGFLTRVDDS